jgi:ABC-type phosphonate transport system ATPase subunit
MREPGRTLSRDIARGEAVEKELDVFVSRRDTKRRESEGERAVEELWQVSERLHDADRRESLRSAWCAFHRDQADRLRRNLAALVAHHEAEAEKLMKTNEQRRTA